MMKNQKGFSLVEGLLIFIVIGLIGFAGYYVWNQQKDNSSSSEQTKTNIDQSTDEVANLKDIENEQETNDRYVYVADWGVYLGLGDYSDKVTISDVTVGFNEGETELAIKVINEYDFYSDCETEIRISRLKDVSSFDTTPDIKVGEYYYRNSGVSECGGATESDNQNTVSAADLISTFNDYRVKE